MLEIFIDGGLFELFIAVALSYLINFIFLKKTLLLVYSVLILAVPIGLYFIHSGDWFYLLASIALVNSILLVVLLWQARHRDPNQPLFEVKNYRQTMNDQWVKLKTRFNFHKEKKTSSNI
jgi:hypothetical protein